MKRSTVLATTALAVALLSGLWLAADESDPALHTVCVDLGTLIASGAWQL